MLIVMLIGFTVMQNAFAGSGLAHGAVSDVERKALALTGGGDIIFDWDVAAGPHLRQPRGRGATRPRRAARSKGRPPTWLDVLHPFDATATAPVSTPCWSSGAAASTRNSGCAPPTAIISGFACKARPVVGPDGEVMRVVGTLSDMTEIKTSEERLLHDAVHDNLTGLPNRELFFDRLEAALAIRPDGPKDVRPTVIMHRHRPFQADQRAGRAVAPAISILLTVARRLDAAVAAAGHAGALRGRSVRRSSRLGNRDRARHRARQRGASRACDAGDCSATRRFRLIASIGVALVRSRNCTPSARTC